MSWMQRSYPLFIYLGILFFIGHLILYGKGIDQSYFGVFLIYVGYSKMQLSPSVFIILWILCAIEIMNMGDKFNEKYVKPFFSQPKQEKKE